MFRISVIFGFLSLGVIWGGAFVAIKILLNELPPFWAAALRVWIATPFLWLIFRVRGESIQVPGHLRVRIWVTGLFMIGLPYAFLFWGESRVAAGTAGILNGTTPLFTTLILVLPFSPWFDHRQIVDRNLILGILLGFLGLLAIFYPHLSGSFVGASPLALLAIVGMALCYSMSNVLNARLLVPENKLSIAGNVFHQHLFSLAFLTLVAFIGDGWTLDWAKVMQPRILGALLFLGLLSGGVAMIVYYFLIREIGAIRAAALTYIIPVAAVVLDFLVLGHRAEGSALLGAGLILVAIFFVRNISRTKVAASS